MTAPACCPVCSGPLEVEELDVTTRRDADAGFRRTLEGRWSCPDGCDPTGATDRDRAEHYRRLAHRETLERVDPPAGRTLDVSTPDDPSSRLRSVVRQYLERELPTGPQRCRLVTDAGPLEHGSGWLGQDVTFTITDETAVGRLDHQAYAERGLVVLVSAEEAERGREDLAAFLDGVTARALAEPAPADVPGRMPGPPPAPYCADCSLPIHADRASHTGYVHARSLRTRCADGRGDAHPRP